MLFFFVVVIWVFGAFGGIWLIKFKVRSVGGKLGIDFLFLFFFKVMVVESI